MIRSRPEKERRRRRWRWFRWKCIGSSSPILYMLLVDDTLKSKWKFHCLITRTSISQIFDRLCVKWWTKGIDLWKGPLLGMFYSILSSVGEIKEEKIFLCSYKTSLTVSFRLSLSCSQRTERLGMCSLSDPLMEVLLLAFLTLQRMPLELGYSYAWKTDDIKPEEMDVSHLISKELSLKIVNKIEAGESYAIYVVIPMWPEGVPEIDDEYIMIGSANINQRSMDGNRASELAMGAYQPFHLSTREPARGQIHGFRTALCYEHLGLLASTQRAWSVRRRLTGSQTNYTICMNKRIIELVRFGLLLVLSICPCVSLACYSCDIMLPWIQHGFFRINCEVAITGVLPLHLFVCSTSAPTVNLQRLEFLETESGEAHINNRVSPPALKKMVYELRRFSCQLAVENFMSLVVRVGQDF
ncbi:hypothetical protein OPV22_023916 [Ensete ventricosum]|uniref:Phospholipase D n=1 Tax=Ensete ventricosum TaxID=4639 RepID=A0AAV8QXT7_ENSVE|nr:hypothetical protein OPV22_023916 [Ensete ventricosum]